MARTNVEIVQELFAGATDPAVVDRLVADDAVYVSLAFDNPDLQRIWPWAGTHPDGKAAILKTFIDVHRYWTVLALEQRQVLADGDNVAIFGSFTLRSARLGKTYTSPFVVLATVRDGRVTYMQYMEDTFGTHSIFRSGGTWRFESNPDGGTVEI